MSETIHVSMDLAGMTVPVGVTYLMSRGNHTSSTFHYDAGYLSRRAAYAIDPAMPLSAGAHAGHGLPGVFRDCSPDRWGTDLIRKRLRAQALQEGRTPPTVRPTDLLLGVGDVTRQGALRFRTDPEGPFLDPDNTVPNIIDLPHLLNAADLVSRNRGDDSDLEAIKVLLDAGTGTLGGARPKASVRDAGRLKIAKFPHPQDDWDVMAWEATCLNLARRAGIRTPPHLLVRVAGRHVLLLDRFDRTDSGRVGYISAMTLIEAVDGVPRDYTEIAETFPEHAADTTTDLRQLWRRVAFSMIIHNTDDHLRNHGFLAGGGGWTLAPAFDDVNPNPDGCRRSGRPGSEGPMPATTNWRG